ncbi:hypothetical protein FIBSPDRAFT_76636 [Athelia psychrophila]|uniref:Uncharacterized protein n=1 Tax=Athelia psychrophila TaxID=1759441 RepID=A0A166EFN8_9AGAM|nr:hypothetical protein FIBSPDRAFT_76636 [Fibularhizoctonia sp. CBS 109695]
MRKLKLNGHPPPETRMCTGQVGGIPVPIAVRPHVHSLHVRAVDLPNSNYRVYPIRHWPIVRIHLHIRVPCLRLPPHRRLRHGCHLSPRDIRGQ